MIFSIIYLAIIVVTIAGGWKMFEKAGKPGWAFLVPIYNVIVMLEIINKPIKWLLFLIIPILNIVYCVKLYIGLAKAFGKGTGFGIGMIFLPFVFVPMIGFGDAEYQQLAPENAPIF
ncbi:MAG: DUF5684 domain-containing protein [Tannerellaceae bacterium]|nr:DUF5684 domain-containing protein [Tannerellaceae bacterium]